MNWSQRAVLSLALAVLTATPALAQIVGHPLEFSGGAGVLRPDVRAFRKNGPAYTGALGLRVAHYLTLEAQGLWAPSKGDTAPEPTSNFTYAGLDLRWNLRAADSHVVPFLLTGGGYGMSHDESAVPAKLERGAGSVGAGVLGTVGGSQRWFWRAQARDVFFRERDDQEFSNHIAATLGLQYVFGGKQRDQDLDKVRDWLDKCPNTPIGAVVDRNGCPIDSDGDGVFDGLDKCPDTPKGCKVDKTGCPIDADGDGVCDGVDQCPDTPKGATVDARGCPGDADGDAVLDGIDQCPGTPKGCTVDARGCPTDADGDGVCDGLDQCPDTPKDLKVDEKGCPIEVNVRETELIDTGRIRIQDVNFDTGKSDIKPEFEPTLKAVGVVLTRWPSLKMELAGHTDSRGSAAMNRRLSQARAQSVLNYLVAAYPTIDAKQFVVTGYGEDKPIASNKTPQGMAQNRRVEFTVLNKDVFKVELEKRRVLNKAGEPIPVPADTSGKK